MLRADRRRLIMLSPVDWLPHLPFPSWAYLSLYRRAFVKTCSSLLRALPILPDGGPVRSDSFWVYTRLLLCCHSDGAAVVHDTPHQAFVQPRPYGNVARYNG